MEHLNPHLTELGKGYLRPFLPESYAASTLRDILDGKSAAQMSGILFPPFTGFYGSCLILLPRAQYHEVKGYLGDLSDVTTKIPVQEPFHLYADRDAINRLEDGMWLYHIMLSYTRKANAFRLVKFELHGPSSTDKSPGFLDDLVPSFLR